MPLGAFEQIGRDISLDALEREVMKDDISHVRRRRHAFWRRSVNAGGVCYPFLQRLRLWGVSCAIETAGDAPANKLLPLAKLCDEVLFDLKLWTRLRRGMW